MASARAIPTKRLSTIHESYNGCTVFFTASHTTVEKSVGGAREQQPHLTPVTIPEQVLSHLHSLSEMVLTLRGGRLTKHDFQTSPASSQQSDGHDDATLRLSKFGDTLMVLPEFLVFDRLMLRKVG